jgi:hypothetical protein
MDMLKQFDLNDFVVGLANDLKDLRAGRISNRDAQARAVLAKQVLRGVHYVVVASKFISENAKSLPSPESDIIPPKLKKHRSAP